jgi:hypothetical protein
MSLEKSDPLAWALPMTCEPLYMAEVAVSMTTSWMIDPCTWRRGGRSAGPGIRVCRAREVIGLGRGAAHHIGLASWTSKGKLSQQKRKVSALPLISRNNHSKSTTEWELTWGVPMLRRVRVFKSSVVVPAINE